jgi:tripartite-type tricarboxylate transporter receptor subunit TctC
LITSHYQSIIFFQFTLTFSATTMGALAHYADPETKMKTLAALLGAICALILPTQVLAQDWPTKPVRIMVGSAPGGGTDAMARAIADRLGPLLKQAVVVENRPGVSNTLAADVTAKSTDGHTMVMGVSTAHAIAPHLLKLGYDSNRDLVPVAFVGAVPNVLVVTSSLPVDSVQSLIKLARSQPGKLNYASSGAGSTQHIAAELFKSSAGVFITHIPYRGSGPATVDLVSGQVQMSFDTMPSVLGQIRAGRLKALAVASARRNPQLPDVPTLAESGLPGVEMSTWYGIFMSASTPKAVQERVHDDVNRILAMPETRTRLEGIGSEIAPMTQAEFAQFYAAEYKRFGEIIKKNNIKLD